MRHEKRPFTVNGIYRSHHHVAAPQIKHWRETFKGLAEDIGLPAMERCHVTVWVELKNRRSIPDTGACYSAVKAAIDGLVDAGCLPDDGPEEIASIKMHAPVVTGVDALEIEVARATSRLHDRPDTP